MALDCSFSLGGEDIWVAVLGREVRISGVGEDIWVAVLGQEVRISGVVRIFGWQF